MLNKLTTQLRSNVHEKLKEHMMKSIAQFRKSIGGTSDAFNDSKSSFCASELDEDQRFKLKGMVEELHGDQIDEGEFEDLLKSCLGKSPKREKENDVDDDDADDGFELKLDIVVDTVSENSKKS